MITLYLQLALSILGAILTLTGLARIILCPEARSRFFRLVLAPAMLMSGYPLMLLIYAQYDTLWPTDRAMAISDAVSLLIPIAASTILFFLQTKPARPEYHA